MKAKFFALSLLTAACMASCSDSSIDTDIISPEQGELTTYRFKANVMLPQEMAGSVTRATDDQTPDDGDNKEWKVDNKKVYFSLYNANGIPLNPAFLENELTWKKDDDQHITIGADVTLKANQKPKYLVVYVNLVDDERTFYMGKNLENLLTGQNNDQTYFRPGHNYLASSLGEDGETFYQRPASFRNMMLERYANLKKDEGGFFMMNSSWNDNWQNDQSGNHNIRAVDISSVVHEESEFKALSDAERGEALVYIERVVAKVNTLFEVPDTPTEEAGKGYKVAEVDGLPIVKINQKSGYNNNNADASYYVKFDGWQLNATNKSFIPLKDIGENPSRFVNIAGNDYQPYRTGRSYWAFDQNYDYKKDNYVTNQDFDENKGWSYGNNRPQLNYYTLTNMKRLKFGMYHEGADKNSTDIAQYTDYCFENTMNGEGTNHTDAVTHVLVRAQYVIKDTNNKYRPYGTDDDGKYVKNADGTYKNIYRVGKTIFTEEQLINYIYAHLEAMYPSKMNDKNQIKLYHNNQDFKNHNDVKSHVLVNDLITTKYTDIKGNEAEVPNEKTTDEDGNIRYKGDVTEIVFGQATVYTFERGVCYYSIPIKHFADNHSVGEEGFYGVVRNHWYQVKISGVNAFGHPATPGEGPRDPSKPKDDPDYDPDKPYDPQNPGGDNPNVPGGKNPSDPDNPNSPGDPKDPNNPGPNKPHDPTDPQHPSDPGKPIIPEDTEDDDFNLNARIKVLPWAKMQMQAQLGGMQTWN